MTPLVRLTYVLWECPKKKREKDDRIFEKKMGKNFLSLIKYININIQEV